MRIILTLLLFGVAVTFAIVGLLRLRFWALLRQTPVVTADVLVADTHVGTIDGARVAVVGRAGAPGRKPLTSPVNKQVCVWHRYTVVHRQTRMRIDSKGRTRRSVRRRKDDDKRSDSPFALVGTSEQVIIEPSGMRIDRPQKAGQARILPGPVSQPFPAGAALAADQSVQSLYIHREWIIRPDTPLYVLGEAVRSGTRLVIRKPVKGPNVISTRPPNEVLRRTQLIAIGMLALAVAAVIVAIGVATGLT